MDTLVKKEEEKSPSQLAAEFIASTNRHVFLTGKAGTGKTTFLRKMAEETHKKFLILAPTGIAALNAGGVTIHSQFLFPLGAFIPEIVNLSESDHGRFYTPKTLAIRHPLNAVRKQVLRDIDLLIIDEVSMLRADILDAIDERLRSVRSYRSKPFGGVQLLLIGDLLQLPPIVKDQEWRILKKYYPSMHFFSSRALRQDGYAYVELDKVYRQADERFISILNNLRNDACTQEDIEALNEHYNPDADRIPNTITLTTHNRQADGINQKELDALDGKESRFSAKVSGDFPEGMYPMPSDLAFKEGAQIMFVKNDNAENRFYNGKLGKIESIGKSHIDVKLAGEETVIKIEPMVWENIKYTVDDQKELQEEKVGKFEQYPIKLAWAVTVHKSQGLTFDRAIIDVGSAFAPGQVYVALSRLRSLDGLTLRTKITPSAISTDREVQSFQSIRDRQTDLETQLRQGQKVYLEEGLISTFDFDPITRQITYIQNKSGKKMEFAEEDMREALPNLKMKFLSEIKNTQIFQNQLRILLRDEDFHKLKERIEKGAVYYLNLLYDGLYDCLLHMEDAAQFARTKTYVGQLGELDQLIMKSIARLQMIGRMVNSIVDHAPLEGMAEDGRKRRAKREAFLAKIEAHLKANPRKGISKTGKRKKKGPTQKGATFQETYRLVKDGLSVKNIAIKRSLTESTIESHIARGIGEGELDLDKFLETAQISEISDVFGKGGERNLADVHAEMKGKYSYGQLRMVQSHMRRQSGDLKE